MVGWRSSWKAIGFIGTRAVSALGEGCSSGTVMSGWLSAEEGSELLVVKLGPSLRLSDRRSWRNASLLGQQTGVDSRCRLKGGKNVRSRAARKEFPMARRSP